RTIRTRMAISSNDYVPRKNITAFRHHLMTDAFLQNGNILFSCECANITLQSCYRKSCGRNNMIITCQIITLAITSNIWYACREVNQSVEVHI
ncbi:MAG TPA: hypothetical protein VE843_07385, partial [Ktedonobacteraceae bacterium]|nr:hypothetical protein [Ktedonobacteraceae bacterium]